MNVRMELSRIFIREMTDMQIIELTEIDGTRSFPIVIGLPEAFAIERRLKGQQIPRPQTHDLCASLIEQLGGTLVAIDINDLDEGTFYARLRIDTADGPVEVDSRPSDAIALGIAADVPIYVAEHVLDAADSHTGEDPTDVTQVFPIDLDDEDDDDDDDDDDTETPDAEADDRPREGGPDLHWD